MRVASALSLPGQVAVREVAARRTPASLAQVRTALERALQAAMGQPPPQAAVGVLAAQVSLETARGDKMYNFNFGGIKGASPSGETASYMTREVLQGRDALLPQSFRAYESLDAGASDYVSVLRARFPEAFARAAAGDLAGFAHALKQSHYYTASEHDYTVGLEAAAGGPVASPVSAASMPADFSSSAELSRVLDAVAASAARIVAPGAES